MIQGIEHTAICSPDTHRLAAWYVEHLGFVVNYRSSRSKTVFVKAANGYMLEIMESAPGTAPVDSPFATLESSRPGGGNCGAPGRFLGRTQGDRSRMISVSQSSMSLGLT